MSANIWLLSAYQADSHQAWAKWLQTNIDLPWQLYGLPGRYFRWRIRGNPLSWLDVLPATAPRHVLATSMVDLATLKGVLPQLNGVATSLYFHENQFAYPVSSAQHQSVDPLMVQIYSALSADELLFNSDYNRQSFLQGVAALLKKMPDQVPQGVPERLAAKAHILPVPVAGLPGQQAKRALILWPHRWEYDKAPQRFVRLLNQLADQGVEFELALLGARPSKPTPELVAIRQRFARCIIADGFVSREQYLALLSQTQVVVSTAIHEFQGLAMLEAVSAGAVPVVPDDLCYREQYPRQCRYQSDEQAIELIKQALAGQVRAPDVTPWLAGHTASQWRQWARRLSCQ